MCLLNVGTETYTLEMPVQCFGHRGVCRHQAKTRRFAIHAQGFAVNITTQFFVNSHSCCKGLDERRPTCTTLSPCCMNELGVCLNIKNNQQQQQQQKQQDSTNIASRLLQDSPVVEDVKHCLFFVYYPKRSMFGLCTNIWVV